jgi:3-phosphoshikimate 1-carboxyvinyltransferase
MNLLVSSSLALRGDVDLEIPGDKSISHRAALFSALAEGKSTIERFQVSGVTRPMLQALIAMNVDWKLDGDTLIVNGRGFTGLQVPSLPIDCGNSATTLRLLTGAIAAAGLPAILQGSTSLNSRPMGRIIEPLQKMGVEIQASPAGTAPLKIERRSSQNPLLPLEYSLPVASAQVKSCLLLAALGSKGISRIDEPGLSRDHSERMLRGMGVDVRSSFASGKASVEIVPPDPLRLQPLNLTIPGDPSAAAFLIVAALITLNSEITLRHICLNPTRTGLIEVLLAMGGDISILSECMEGDEPCGDLVVRSSQLHGTQVDGDLVVRMIDEFPIFAIAAAAADGPSTVHDASELRVKESDRIGRLAAELRILGVQIGEYPDGFRIEGGSIRGGTVSAYGDHRLAMSLAIAGLISSSPVCVQGSECSDESFPGFMRLLHRLGASVVEEAT